MRNLTKPIGVGMVLLLQFVREFHISPQPGHQKYQRWLSDKASRDRRACLFMGDPNRGAIRLSQEFKTSATALMAARTS
jgi:hypothetical protein